MEYTGGIRGCHRHAANKKKFEVIRCGALMRKLIPTLPELKAELIKWVPKGGYVRSPFIWELYDYNSVL